MKQFLTVLITLIEPDAAAVFEQNKLVFTVLAFFAFVILVYIVVVFFRSTSVGSSTVAFRNIGIDFRVCGS
jgi:hypothetical protein